LLRPISKPVQIDNSGKSKGILDDFAVRKSEQTRQLKVGANVLCVNLGEDGKVGIGTSTPTAKLDINAGGTTNILIGQNTGATTYNLISLNGNASDTGKIGMTGGGGTDKNLYIDRPSGGTIVFREAAGTGQITILTGGNVGIGTTTPATKLDIKSAGNGEYIQQWTNSNGNVLGLVYQGSSGDGQFYLADSTGTYRTRIIGTGDSYFNGGNVGIGRTTPTRKLHVNGTAAFELPNTGLAIVEEDADTVSFVGYKTDDTSYNNILIRADVGGLIVEKGTGNVGIGTTNPEVKLDITGKLRINPTGDIGDNYNEGIRITNGSNGYSVIHLGGGVASSGTGVGQWTVLKNPINNFEIWENGEVLMTILSNGNVGIGTTLPVSKLSVGGVGYIKTGIYGSDGNVGVYGDGLIGVYGSGSDTGVSGSGSYTGVVGSGNDVGVDGRGNVGVLGFGSNYDFYATGAGTDYGTSSSIRWKDNITEINPQLALDKILMINGSYFNWKDSGEHDFGFIAEQIGEIVPEVMEYEVDILNESNWYTNEKGEKKLYATGVDYGALTPMLVQAIKGQQIIIINQNNTINLLQNRLDDICKLNNLNGC
jgi:hypothetical protein